MQVISIDAKILLNEWTYKKLHEFARLSVIENRLVVIPFVKLYLQVVNFFFIKDQSFGV